ncbi:MAG TPA: nucleotidyltransferase family protein [Candidatus Deferrimicrobium sp.]|nr:nucleotidyltransferase family protein [Candidatus Deferrimicrobium sp.]
MLSKEEILDKLRNQLLYLKKKFNVKKIGIFGSYAQGIQDPESDIDILVEFEKPIGFLFVDLAEYLEDLFNKKVDILTSEGINSIRIQKVVRDIERSIIYA